MKLNVLRLALAVAPKLKGWIFADGKFSLKRAGTLLIAFVMILLGIHFIGLENTQAGIELLDEISDVVGYEE